MRTIADDLAVQHRARKQRRAVRHAHKVARLHATWVQTQIMLDPNHTEPALSGDVDVEYEAHRIAQGFLSSRGQ